MQEENIKTLSFGCRLNALESEKIKNMLNGRLKSAIIVNSCAVTAEAERQSGQAVRKISRENPDVPIFVTGCAATRNPDLFNNIPNTIVVSNFDKTNVDVYLRKFAESNLSDNAKIVNFKNTDTILSKQFVQIQNGCNHKCAYCVTRLLRGNAVSFPYNEILADVKQAVKNGFFEIVLTGVDSASYAYKTNDKVLFISDVCKMLLDDVPEIKRLRISSLDPASPQIFKIIDLIHNDTRMMPHLHLSMQSGANDILKSMGRRHNADLVKKIVNYASDITFSWDIICGFPGETDELFNETLDLVRKTKPIKIHAFPFSPRPDTVGAIMPNQVPHYISKKRVKVISELANKNMADFMATQTGKTTSVLVENNNIARTPDDIDVIIVGDSIPAKTICDVKITEIKDSKFIGNLV
ncbi:MAG: MiaB/RimO family radical SAM methylthiotransferase [Alphaproteobacteria bacterium]